VIKVKKLLQASIDRVKKVTEAAKKIGKEIQDKKEPGK